MKKRSRVAISVIENQQTRPESNGGLGTPPPLLLAGNWKHRRTSI